MFGALLLSGFLATAIVAGALITQPATLATDTFLKSLGAEDYAAAYDMCDPALQKEFGSVQKLAAWGKNQIGRPEKWSFNSREVDSDSAELDGKMTMSGSRQEWFSVVLTKVDKQWRVAGFQMIKK
jgi:hypothetical protein